MDFFYEGYIANEGSTRHNDGGGKPVPGEKGREEKESVVFHLKSHKYLEGDKKDEGEKNWI